MVVSVSAGGVPRKTKARESDAVRISFHFGILFVQACVVRWARVAWKARSERWGPCVEVPRPSQLQLGV